VDSLCSPSRAAFLTGRYNHLNGIVDNRTPLPEDATTFASLLRAAGYRTGYFGKWHMGTQSGPRPGFDVSASYVGHGTYFDASFEIDGVPTPTRGFIDDVATDLAIDFLGAERDRPFLLVLGLKAPHGPRRPPPRFEEKYAGRKARAARNADHEPPFLARPEFTAASTLKRLEKKRAGRAVERPLGSQRLLDYFRLVSAADENVGRLLAALDELGLSERTVVVFASDNGYYLGEHGLGGKRSAYEESLRIPLLVRHPGLAAGAGRVVDRMALNIDLAPTLLDLAGVEVPAGMQGRSWRPLLEGRPGDWRSSFLYEYFFETDFNAPPIVALRTETAKLIRYPGHDAWTELYDLVADPYELTNLAEMRPALLEELQRELELQARQVGFRVPEHADPVPQAAAGTGWTDPLGDAP
jgi:arylsulfatase A-like enzyme